VVPQQRQAARRPQHPVDLGQRADTVEPMERLAHEVGVDRPVPDRDLLGGAVQQRRLQRPRRQQTPHPGQRFDRDQLAGSRGQRL
jgi:hypothetical protein